MFNDQAVAFIRSESDKGTPNEAIYQSLIGSGWDHRIVVQSFIYVFGGKVGLHAMSLPRFKDLLEETAKFFSARFKPLFLISLIPNLFFGFLGTVTAITADVPVISLVIALISAILTAAVGTWTSAALFLAIAHGGDMDFRSAYRESWKRVFRFWVTSSLMGLAIVAGLIFFIIPGLLFAVWFTFVPFVFFAEEREGMKALYRSKEIVRGYEVSIVWKQLVIMLCFGGYVAGLSFLTEIILGFTGPFGVLKPMVNSIIYSFSAPIPVIFVYLLYRKIQDIRYLTGSTQKE